MSMFSRLEALSKSVQEAIEELEKTYSVKQRTGVGTWGSQSKSKDQIKREPQGSTGREVKVLTDDEKANFKPAVKQPLARSETCSACGKKDCMCKTEAKEGSPAHEAKEKKIGEKVKEEAQDLLDMHKVNKSDPKPPKAENAPKPPKIPATLDYSKMSKPKAPEAEAPTISYSHTAAPMRTPGASTAEAGFKVPKEKQKILSNPDFRSRLSAQRRAAGVMKAEQFGILTPEALTKSMRAQHSDVEITQMIKAAVDSGKLHRNVLLEWANFGTVNPSIVLMPNDEE